MEYAVCHYHEVALKGKNRRFFEEKLVENIKRVLPDDSFEFVRRISGRVLVKLSQKGGKRQKTIRRSLGKVFGLANFALAVNSPQEIRAIKKKALRLLEPLQFKSFKIETQRSKKDFPLTSFQINEQVGEFIVRKLKKKVNLEKPDRTCFIEIVENFAFLYLEKIKGLGGLPVTTGGRAIALLSGGIDSPVAAWMIMKRGVKVIFLHFHSFPHTDYASIEKAGQIVNFLSPYQGRSKLYLVPFGKIQEEILTKTPAKLRVILYRRMMMRIAKGLAQKEKAPALVTGESIGQVASQTLENIRAIEEAVNWPLLRPLIGQDKQEIIRLAKKLGTFPISILPHQDCCSRFLPPHPETRAQLKEVQEAEKALDVEKLVKTATRKAEVKHFDKF